jgi:hypothetical protein
MYDGTPGFTRDCHAVTHEMGKAAYELYKRGEKIEPLPEFSYCSFGFYHGFQEALMADTNDPHGARAFCDRLQAAVADGRSILPMCLHGFGHGVTDGYNPKLWGSETAITSPGLAMCISVGKNYEEWNLCAGGVFNALGGMYKDAHFRLHLDSHDPYRFCRAQTYAPFREACYRNFKSVVAELNHDHFLPAAHQVEAIQDRENAIEAMDSLATYQARLMTASYMDTFIVSMCYSLKQYLQGPCIGGFATGLIVFSEPGQEYKRGLAYCEEPSIRGADRAECFKTFAWDVKVQYSQDTYRKVCAMIPKEYRSVCS